MASGETGLLCIVNATPSPVGPPTMKRSSLLLTLTLSCVLPLTALAKEPRKQKEPTPSMTKQQTEALSKCMQQCQQPKIGRAHV